MEADARLEARAAAAAALSSADEAFASSASYDMEGENAIKTFEPGEGKSAEESFATQFTMEEKAKIREMVANAASAEEIDRIEKLVKRGIFPGSAVLQPPPPPPPPPPLPEMPPQSEFYHGEKRSAEGGGIAENGGGEEPLPKKQRPY